MRRGQRRRLAHACGRIDHAQRRRQDRRPGCGDMALANAQQGFATATLQRDFQAIQISALLEHGAHRGPGHFGHQRPTPVGRTAAQDLAHIQPAPAGSRRPLGPASSHAGVLAHGQLLQPGGWEAAVLSLSTRQMTGSHPDQPLVVNDGQRTHHGVLLHGAFQHFGHAKTLPAGALFAMGQCQQLVAGRQQAANGRETAIGRDFRAEHKALQPRLGIQGRGLAQGAGQPHRRHADQPQQQAHQRPGGLAQPCRRQARPGCWLGSCGRPLTRNTGPARRPLQAHSLFSVLSGKGHVQALRSCLGTGRRPPARSVRSCNRSARCTGKRRWHRTLAGCRSGAPAPGPAGWRARRPGPCRFCPLPP